DELAPRRWEPVEPGRRAEAAAQAERRRQREPERCAPTMAAQGEPGYLAAQSDPGSNSERSTDSPMPGSEDDLVAGATLHSPEWSEERFRVDRKKLEAMLQGRHPPCSRTPRLSLQLLLRHPHRASRRQLLQPTAGLAPGPLPRGAGGHPGTGDFAGLPTRPRLSGFQALGALCELDRLQKSRRPSLYWRAQVAFWTLEMPTLARIPGLCHPDHSGRTEYA
ncbi:hypothetical protein H8957_017184, partial [Semnopithecus entellus]